MSAREQQIAVDVDRGRRIAETARDESVFRIGDIVAPTRESRCDHPFSFCLVRTNSGIVKPPVLFGRRIMKDGTLAKPVTTIVWLMRKTGRWTDDAHELAGLELSGLEGAVRLRDTVEVEPVAVVPCSYSVGDWLERATVRAGKGPTPSLYQVTKLVVAMGKAVPHGRRVVRSTGELTGPEIAIKWRVRAVKKVAQ